MKPIISIIKFLIRLALVCVLAFGLWRLGYWQGYLEGVAYLPSITEIQAGELWRVTAYCPCEKCCGRFADGITASGHVIQKGDKFCAAPTRIPFGTMIDIPNYGIVPVLDRGGSIKADRLDVFFDTHEEALNWGIKYLDVEIMTETQKLWDEIIFNRYAGWYMTETGAPEE